MTNDNQILDNSKFGFTQNELSLIETVTKKYNSISEKTDKHEIFLALIALQNPTPLDIKKIRAILDLEKKLVQMGKKQSRLNNLLKQDRIESRKRLETKKYVLGGGVLSGLDKNMRIGGKFGDLTYADLYIQMLQSGILEKRNETGAVIDKPYYDKDGIHLFNDYVRLPNIAPKPKPTRKTKNMTSDGSSVAPQSTQTPPSTNTQFQR